MTSQVPRARTTKRWLAICEASSLLDVLPVTLRRWADTSEITAFGTPGAHQRFPRSAVLRLLPVGRRTDNTVARVRRGASRNDDEPQWLRRRGTGLATALRGIVGAATPAEHEAFAEADEAAAMKFGWTAGCQGVGMADTLELFLHFRLPLLRDLTPSTRRRSLGAANGIDPVETATEATHHLMGAVVRGHQSAGAESSLGSSITPTRRGPTTDEVIGP